MGADAEARLVPRRRRDLLPRPWWPPAICRTHASTAAACAPRLLLLDEPMAGLSPGERQAVLALLGNIGLDIPLVMIEHDMDLALDLADRVTVLHYGEVIAEGTPAEIRANPTVQEIYLGEEA